jgi:hypothetical protein
MSTTFFAKPENGLISGAKKRRNLSAQYMYISGLLTLTLCLFTFSAVSQDKTGSRQATNQVDIPDGVVTALVDMVHTNGASQVASPFTLSIIDLTESGCVEIPASHEGAVFDEYQFERIESHFADIPQLKKHLGHISSNRFTFMLDVDETAIIMHLHKDRVQPEQANSVASWNNYIQGKCIQL